MCCYSTDSSHIDALTASSNTLSTLRLGSQIGISPTTPIFCFIQRWSASRNCKALLIPLALSSLAYWRPMPQISSTSILAKTSEESTQFVRFHTPSASLSFFASRLAIFARVLVGPMPINTGMHIHEGQCFLHMLNREMPFP